MYNSQFQATGIKIGSLNWDSNVEINGLDQKILFINFNALKRYSELTLTRSDYYTKITFMKMLLQGSIALTLFAISIMLFQMSCKKDALAQNSTYSLPVASNSTLGGVIVGAGLNIDNSGRLSCPHDDVILYFKMTSPNYEWWVCDRNGGNQRKVNFPSTITVTQLGVSLLSDKNTVVFSGTATTIPLGVSDLYTMNIDGSNLHRIVVNSGVNLAAPVAYW